MSMRVPVRIVMYAGKCSEEKRRQEQWGITHPTEDGGSTQNVQIWIFWGKCLRK